MGKINYATGIAILQFIVFPFIFAAALFVWKRTGWRIGSKIWRYPATLSLLRIAGSVAQFVVTNHYTKDAQIAVVVCELIGIAPLVLTYIGLLRQIDHEQRMPPRALFLVTLVAIIALILAIAGVTTADSNQGYTPGKLAKVAMAMFLVVFAVTMLLSVWLFYTISFSMLQYQKKLFLAIGLSAPFVLVRMVYSALSDYTDIDTFKYGSNWTVYLCMSVLEEIVACMIILGFGVFAVLQPDFVKLSPEQKNQDQQDPEEGKPLSAGQYDTAYHGANAAYGPVYPGAQTPGYNPIQNNVYQTPPHNA